MPPNANIIHAPFDNYTEFYVLHDDALRLAIKILSQNKTPKGQAVTFASCPTVIEIPSADCLSELEKNMSWYSKEDYQRFKNSAQKTIELISKTGRNFDQDGQFLCSRGLEHWTREKVSLYRERRRMVMDELSRMIKAGNATPERVSIVVSGYSMPCIHEALRRGRLDQEYAVQYQNEADS